MPINGINNIINQTAPGNQGTSGTQQSTANAFASLLSSYMGMSAGSIGNFGTSGSGGSFMDGMAGLGGSSSMGGMGGNSDMMMLMMMMLMMNKDGGGASGNPLASLLGNGGTSAAQAQCQHTYVGAYAQNTGIPTTSWLVANPPLTNHIGERSAPTYRAVIDQFNVEGNERYRVNKNGKGDTYCNIFAWDVTRAMGAEVPHFITANGVPAEAAGAGIRELDANGVNDWLNTYGASYGWRKATPEEAQQYANQGMPAVTSWKNGSGHGHLQVVSPSRNGAYDPQKGVSIAQAGRQLINDGYASDAYLDNKFSEVEYFVHI